jgi:gluconate 2-dehydrogenase gamma chain
MWLDRESYAKFGKLFADAAEDQQKQLLDRIAWPARAANEDHAWVEFFNRFRDLTVSGFFSSRAGVADLPYLGNRRWLNGRAATRRSGRFWKIA